MKKTLKEQLKEWEETKKFNDNERNDKWKNKHRQMIVRTDCADELI